MADNLATFMSDCLEILGASTSWNPQGLLQACTGIAKQEDVNNAPTTLFGTQEVLTCLATRNVITQSVNVYMTLRGTLKRQKLRLFRTGKKVVAYLGTKRRWEVKLTPLPIYLIERTPVTTEKEADRGGR
jgi:hypothetical protein